MSDQSPEEIVDIFLPEIVDEPAMLGDPIVALEPATEPVHPLRAMDIPALLPKDIG